MIEEEIKKTRNKLNKSITNGEKYETIYKLSVELDELITKFYLENKNIAWWGDKFKFISQGLIFCKTYLQKTTKYAKIC